MKQTVSGYLKSINKEFTKENKPYQNLLVLIPGQKDQFGQPIPSAAGKDKIFQISNFKDGVSVQWLESMINKPVKIDAWLNCSPYGKSDGSIGYIYNLNLMSISAINMQQNSQNMSSDYRYNGHQYQQEHTQPVNNNINDIVVDDLPF